MALIVIATRLLSLAMQYWYYRRHKFFIDESWIIAYDKIQRGKAIMSVLFQEMYAHVFQEMHALYT